MAEKKTRSTAKRKPTGAAVKRKPPTPPPTVTDTVEKIKAALVSASIKRGDFDSVNFNSPDSLLGYELVVFELENAFREYQYSASRYQGLPSLTESQSYQIGADSSRRRSELIQILKAGATVVFLAPRPLPCFVDLGQREYSGTGRNRQTTIVVQRFDLWQRTVPSEFRMEPGRGKSITFNDQPSAVPFKKVQDSLVHEAIIGEDKLTPLANITGTGNVVAAIGKVEAGHVVLLPKVRDEDQFASQTEWLNRYSALLNAIKELRKRLRPSRKQTLPEWASQVVTETEIAENQTLEKRLAALAEVQAQVEQSNAQLRALQEPKLLLGGTGKSLEEAVAKVLRRFGFQVEMPDDDRTDLILMYEGKVAVSEVKGLTGSAGENNAAQLEKWVSLYHEEQGVEPKGILIVNHFREQPILTRNNVPFPSQMMNYVKRKELALVTTSQLFIANVIFDSDPDRVKGFCEAMFSTIGIVDSDFTDPGEVLRSTITESKGS